MNQTVEPKEPTSQSHNEGCCGICQHLDYTLAFLVLRGWLGLRAVATGIEKFGAYKTIQKAVIDAATGMEDPSGAMIEVKQKAYSLHSYAAIPDSLKDKFAHEP